MGLSGDVKAVLLANSALMTLLTGGVYNNFSEVSRQNTPAAFDANKEIKPCVLIKEGNEVPSGPYPKSVRTTMNIYFYQLTGFDIIEQAMNIILNLLHETQIGDNTWQILYDGRLLDSRLGDIRDIALDCSMGVERFAVVRNR